MKRGPGRTAPLKSGAEAPGRGRRMAEALASTALVLCLGFGTFSGGELYRAHRIANLLQLGRKALAQNRPEAAQDIADRMATDEDEAARAVLLYDIGNYMMRRALPIYFTRPMREVAPLIRVAKAEYRQALQIDPQNWDARFNLDVAESLVREVENPVPKSGSTMAQDKATIPDEPGVPNGMP